MTFNYVKANREFLSEVDGLYEDIEGHRDTLNKLYDSVCNKAPEEAEDQKVIEYIKYMRRMLGEVRYPNPYPHEE